MNRFSFLLYTFFLVFSASCADDAQDAKIDVQKKQLMQNWELIEAQRNGRKTETMVDAFLHFSENNQIVVNLDGSAQKAKWELEDNFFTVSETNNSALSTDYHIQELTDSTLTISLKMRDMPFLLKFIKEKQ